MYHYQVFLTEDGQLRSRFSLMQDRIKIDDLEVNAWMVNWKAHYNYASFVRMLSPLKMMPCPLVLLRIQISWVFRWRSVWRAPSSRTWRLSTPSANSWRRFRFLNFSSITTESSDQAPNSSPTGKGSHNHIMFHSYERDSISHSISHSRLYKSLCRSVRPSVRRSVCPSVLLCFFAFLGINSDL